MFSEGARLEARLTGFKGGQGILELWQRTGKRPQIMIIMTGLEGNKVRANLSQPVLKAYVCRTIMQYLCRWIRTALNRALEEDCQKKRLKARNSSR